MSRNGIVCVGIGNWHPKGVERLQWSLKGNFNGDFIQFTENYPPECPTHQDIPYAFKPYAFEHMRKAGYKKVMWMDSSVWLIDNINFIFDGILEYRGYFMEDSGHNVGTWATDKCLDHFGYFREDAFKIPMFIAGCFGLNFDTVGGNLFLDRWLSEIEYFKGNWTNKNGEVSKDPRVQGHRHDMTVGSIIAKEMELEYFNNNTFMSYYGWYQKYKTDPNFNTSMVKFLLEGM